MKRKRNWLLIGFTFCAYANPHQMTIVSGQAQQELNGSALDVTVSDRAILNWESFSIQPNEATRFIQPSKHAAVLNRVIGNEMSELLGSLQSNGQVYLINPNGVVIGKNGRIDTAGFVAAALEIRPDDFLKGQELLFSGDSRASIINLGTIQTSGGPVALLAHRVENQGLIAAEDSLVSLASGHEILLQLSGHTELFIRPDLPSEGVDSTGVIRALEAQLQADGAIPLAIHLGGEVQANSVVQEGGRFYLRAPEGGVSVTGTVRVSDGEISIVSGPQIHVQGELDVSGEKGGALFLFADRIHLESGRIDASGETSAGEIRIGQRERGNYAKGANASYLEVGNGFELFADAKQSGNGGSVLLLSDKIARIYGPVSAQSLGAFGQGGNVEISGREALYVTGLSDVRSQNGRAGFVLHDPLAVTIISGADTPPVSDTYTSGYISNQLSLGNFSITTAPDAGVITFSGASTISWSTPNTFQLIGRSITTSGGAVTIQNTSNSMSSFTAVDFRANIVTGTIGTGSFQGITFTDMTIIAASGAGQVSLAGQGGVDVNNEAIVLDNTSITTLSGTISVAGFFLTGVDSLAPSDVHLLNGTDLTSTSGQITVSAQQGNILIDGTSTINGTDGNILLNAGSSYSGAGSTIEVTGLGATVTLFVLRAFNPSPSPSFSAATDVNLIIALAASLAGQYPIQLGPQSLITTIYYGAGNQSPRVGCVTAPVAVGGAP